MSIIVTKGTLDWAYPPFILATTGASMGLDVTLCFTFYGLALCKKLVDLVGGTIAVDAAAGGEFAVTVRLPTA
jgi:peroxiredoxin family protein